MTPFDLRPLTVGELLDRSFTLYRRHWILMVGIMAVPSSFALALAVLLQVTVRMPALNPENPPDLQKMLPILAGGFVGYVTLMVVYWITYMLALGATTMAVAGVYAGRVAGTIREAYARVQGQIGRLLWLSFLIMLRATGIFLGLVVAMTLVLGIPIYLGRQQPWLIGIGTFFFVLGLFGVMIFTWLYSLRYTVAMPALVVERITATEAIRRSIHLTRGYFGRVFLLMLCAMVLVYASAITFQMPFLVGALMVPPMSTAALWLNIGGAISGSIGTTLTTPVMIIGFAVLYYDLRVRKEALDLQVMMHALDAPSSPAGNTPAFPGSSSAFPGVPE